MFTERMNKYCLIGLIVFGLEIAGRTYLYLTDRNKKKKVTNAKVAVNEVLFFPDREFPCTTILQQLSVFPEEARKKCLNPSCRRLHGRDINDQSSLLKFLTHLSSAKDTIDLCIYVFTAPSLATLLKELARSGVQIRIITDNSEDEAFMSKVEYLRDYGVVVKSNRENGALMHHKFVVIDGHLLLTGSFNWTNKAVVTNYEAVLVTSEVTLVEPFKLKFNELWSQFPLHPRN